MTFSTWTAQQRGLWFAPLDGSEAASRLTTSANLQIPGAWSHDAHSLVFTELKNGVGDVLMLSRGDRDPRPLVATAADEKDPALSSDERWLAYSSDESGRLEVYMRPFPGSGARYTVSTDGGELPVWSKDGRRLFYVRAERTLMAVDVASGAPFRASNPHALIVSDNLTVRGIRNVIGRSRNFDVARDGRILVVRNPDGESQIDRIRVILNFSQELSRRASSGNP